MLKVVQLEPLKYQGKCVAGPNAQQAEATDLFELPVLASRGGFNAPGRYKALLTRPDPRRISRRTSQVRGLGGRSRRFARLARCPKSTAATTCVQGAAELSSTRTLQAIPTKVACNAQQ